MLATLGRRWFLLLLIATLAIGMSWSTALTPLALGLPRNWIIAGVLLAMAWPLKIDAIWATLRHPAPALLAVAINWLVVPLLAWGASHLLQPDLALGLIIAAAVPSTLASAAVWTRLAGGNEAVSLLVTMLTNLGCFVATPALIAFFAEPVQGRIDFAPMAQQLLVLVVLPIIAAQGLRCWPRCATWATRHRRGLSTAAQLGILSIVLVGAVHCGNKITGLNDQLAPIAGQIGLLLLLVAGVHTVAWLLGFYGAKRLGMAPPEQLAVAFSGSQKTLMVGLTIALAYGGLTVLPMLAYHVVQLLIDTLLAERFRQAA
jgi:sodium/bile acid cotransporter 7